MQSVAITIFLNLCQWTLFIYDLAQETLFNYTDGIMRHFYLLQLPIYNTILSFYSRPRVIYISNIFFKFIPPTYSAKHLSIKYIATDQYNTHSSLNNILPFGYNSYFTKNYMPWYICNGCLF